MGGVGRLTGVGGGSAADASGTARKIVGGRDHPPGRIGDRGQLVGQVVAVVVERVRRPTRGLGTGSWPAEYIKGEDLPGAGAGRNLGQAALRERHSGIVIRVGDGRGARWIRFGRRPVHVVVGERADDATGVGPGLQRSVVVIDVVDKAALRIVGGLDVNESSPLRRGDLLFGVVLKTTELLPIKPFRYPCLHLPSEALDKG